MEKEVIRGDNHITRIVEELGAPISSVIKAGDLVFVSGTPPIDKDGNFLAGDIREQTGARPRQPQAAAGICGIVARQGRQVHTVLHQFGLLELGQRNLRDLLPQRSADSHLLYRGLVAAGIRHRDRVHRHRLARGRQMGARDEFDERRYGAPIATGRTGDPEPPLERSGRIMVHEVHTSSRARAP